MRVVSLVPSLTEAVAATGFLVGATEYCTHPSDLDVARIGGSKYPTVQAVLDLNPDLVLANVEENRKEDVEALQAAGINVLVTYPRTLDEAFTCLHEIFAALHTPPPPWLATAQQAWSFSTVLAARAQRSEHRSRGPVLTGKSAVIPVWRKPWVVLGPGTFAGDVLRRLGVSNVYDDADRPYPRPALSEILARCPDLVVLPDEPYLFTESDGPEAFPGIPHALVSGRHLTWYGPSLVEAADLLRDQLNSGL